MHMAQWRAWRRHALDDSPRPRAKSTENSIETMVVTPAPPAIGTARLLRSDLCSNSPKPRDTTAGAAWTQQPDGEPDARSTEDGRGGRHAEGPT